MDCPCLLCDAAVRVNVNRLKTFKKPAVLCKKCLEELQDYSPALFIRTILLLRNQIGRMYREMDEMKSHIGQLYLNKQDKQEKT